MTRWHDARAIRRPSSCCRRRRSRRRGSRAGGAVVGQRRGGRVQLALAGEPERAPGRGADDAVDFEAVRGLEVAHGGLGFGAEFAVDGDVEGFLQAPDRAAPLLCGYAAGGAPRGVTASASAALPPSTPPASGRPPPAGWAWCGCGSAEGGGVRSAGRAARGRARSRRRRRRRRRVRGGPASGGSRPRFRGRIRRPPGGAARPAGA